MEEVKPRQPGDLILDRYLPNATAEEREDARDNLRAYAAALIAFHERLERISVEKAIRVNGEKDVDLGGQA